MRILLIQFRPDPIMAAHELEIIVRFSNRPATDFVVVDATRDELSAGLLDGADAIVLGGSGDYLISRGDIPEILTDLKPILEEARRGSFPTLGICFGAQILTHAFGGRVEKDEARAEVGTFLVTKTDAGHGDELFRDLPPSFDAQLGHKDHLTVLPEGAVHLASSERSVHQAWKFSDAPVYALTFHPELDEEGVLYRVDYYAKEYKFTPETVATMRAALRPSPEASTILRKFLSTFSGEDNVWKKMSESA